MISQGDVWWADFGTPRGSEPGFRRPVVIIQSDSFNRSRIATVVCVALTSNMRWATAPGNAVLDASTTGLPRDSVAIVSQLATLDRSALMEHVGTLPPRALELVLTGIDVLLGR